MERLGQWLIAHPLTFALSIFVGSCAVSVFAGDLRRFVAIPPQKLNIWILKARISAAEAKLQRLKLLTDTHFLVRHLGGTVIIGLLLLAFMMGALFMVIETHVVGRQSSTFERFLFDITLGLGLGFLAPALLSLITNPKKVEEKIQRLTHKLAAKTNSSKVTSTGV